MTNEEALAIVLQALENTNEELDEADRIEVSPQTRLFGARSVLDSLSLVSMIVDVEQAVSEAVGFPISLTDDRALNQEPSPFNDPESLANYIAEITAERP
jgi:acyl carrier protein